MDPLELLRAKIPDFPGYGDEGDRRRSDELVRSYLGEALAELSQRLAPLSDGVDDRLDALLLRLGFADQRAFSANVRGADALANGAEAAVAADDAGVIELAGRACDVDAIALAAYLGDVSAFLDRRGAAMIAAATS